MLMLTACSKKISPAIPTRESSVTIDSLKPVVLPSDSSMMRALFECDSAGKVILRDYTELKSKGIESSVVYLNGEIRYKNIVKHDTVYVPYREKAVIQECDPIIVKQVDIQIKPLAWWQRALMWEGGIFTVIVIWCIIRIIRRLLITTVTRSR